MDAPARLDAAALTNMVTAVAGLACGDPVELIDHITQLERLKNAAAAAQARLAVELRQVRKAEARTLGRNVKRVPASVAGEIGLARHESPHRANSLVGLATVLTAEMPHTMAAFSAGDLSEWRATVLARETACLSKDHRAEIDAELGPKLADLSTRELAAEARKIAYRLDPRSVVARIGKAEADRNVTIRPAPDCTARVSALLPAAQGVAAYAALTQAADAARASGDERSKNQVMADTAAAPPSGTPITSLQPQPAAKPPPPTAKASANSATTSRSIPAGATGQIPTAPSPSAPPPGTSTAADHPTYRTNPGSHHSWSTSGTPHPPPKISAPAVDRPGPVSRPLPRPPGRQRPGPGPGRQRGPS